MWGLSGKHEAIRLGSTLILLLGLFLTIRGYRCFEGDQAYRLPILLHQSDPSVFANDPFVAYFDLFNPHKGSQALIGSVSRPLGLAVGIAWLFFATFLLTGFGLDLLGRTVWPDRAPGVGMVGVALVLVAQAGNIGTNHLFEPLLLDRMLALALGWCAIGTAVRDPRGGWLPASILIGLIALIHPSLGLQIAFLLTPAWLAWAWLGLANHLSWRVAVLAIISLGFLLVPGYLWNVGDSTTLLRGLSSADFRRLCIEIQGPQHMLPHLWRTPQWLAWGCYPALALIAIVAVTSVDRAQEIPPARKRLMVLLVVNLLGLAIAWFGVEVLQNLKLTIFQPFRLATVARGLSLVLVAGHVQNLWNRGTAQGRTRAGLIATGLIGDWSLVVVTLFECVMTLNDRLEPRLHHRLTLLGRCCGLSVFGGGLFFLARHDTESGHLGLLVISLVTSAFGGRIASRLSKRGGRRTAMRMGIAWMLPLIALAANLVPEPWLSDSGAGAIRLALVKRCRFAEVPVDEVERLAVWCRENTPKNAMFIVPPGQKTFRLWARRGVAFNRAASPYHAAGLSDWAARFRDHVAFEGSTAELVRAYLEDRHGLERRYDRLNSDELVALARRQGAGYVLARSDIKSNSGGLKAIRTEGGSSVYALPQIRSDPRSGRAFEILQSPARAASAGTG